jgi:hypothetical protein
MTDEFMPTEGVALAGYLIAFGLIAVLLGKGVLTPEDADRLIDDQMLMLETLGLSESVRNQAHGILEKTRDIVEGMIAKARDIKPPPTL